MCAEGNAPEAGAPEIEVTPAMIAAGDRAMREVLFECWSGTPPDVLHRALAEVFTIMSRARRS
jgi:hypothetical protein